MLSGGFTWVNFWAAWCVPCREEIPRLMGWQKKLTGTGKSFRLHFVSVDDDEVDGSTFATVANLVDFVRSKVAA